MITPEALHLLHSLEDIDGHLNHIPADSPELLRLRMMLTMPSPKQVKTNVDHKLIKFYRRWNRLSERYMSELIDVHFTVYQDMEAGTRRMSKGQVEIICERLNLDIKKIIIKEC